MDGSARHFFARGNTARGAHYLYESAFAGLSKIYLLSGYPGIGKSTLLQQIADEMTGQGLAVDLFHSPLNPDDLDALIIKDLKVGIADERSCEGLTAISGAALIRIDLGQATDMALLSKEAHQEIETLHSQMLEAYSRAYETFATALAVHDEWEAFYIAAMDFGKADQVAQELIGSFFGDRSRQKEATVRHLFFGAATPRGAVDHIQNLTAGLERRIFIKGRPGSGKSTMLKRVAAAAAEKGFDVEVYHCGFDPNSLDMLIFPELGVAIFDSTAPHEYFPSLSSDEILDMYERAMAPGTDEKHAEALAAIQARYSQKMKEATGYLQEAQQLHAQIKAHYAGATNFDTVSRLGSDLLGELKAVSK